MATKRTKFFLPLILLLLLSLSLTSVPFLASTTIGQRAVVKLLNRKLENKAEIKRISLSWLGPQKVGGVVIKNRSQEVLLHADQVSFESSLPALIWNGLWQSHGTISGLSVEHPLQFMEDGRGTFAFEGKNQLRIALDAKTPNKTPFHLKVQATLDESSAQENVLDIAVSSPAGTLKGALSIGSHIQLQDVNHPLQFDWTIDPSKMDAPFWPLTYSTSEKLTIAEPFEVAGSITQLNIPLEQYFLDTIGLALKMKAKQLHIQNQEKTEELFFKTLDLTLEQHPHGDNLEFSLVGKAANGAMHGDFMLTGTTGLFTPSLNLAVEAKASKLSLPLMAALLPLDKTFINPLTTLVGKRVDIDTQLYLRNMNGPIQIALKGSNGHFSLDGRLQNKNLLLNTPLYLETNVDEDLGRDILTPILPLFSGIMAGEKPLKISIEPENFTLPINDMRIQAATIGKMRVDVGVLHFSNHGELAKLLRPFRGKHDEPIILWFTPLYMSAENGLITLQRTDVLITDRYPTAIWGIIDTEQELINMYVGLSSEALNRALNISLPPQQKMTILPLKGKNGRITIDTSQLKTQIASILAQFLTPASSGQATADLEQTTSFEIALPPSTTTPLPWEGEIKPGGSPKGTDKHKDKKQTQSQLEKKGRALLKRLL